VKPAARPRAALTALACGALAALGAVCSGSPEDALLRGVPAFEARAHELGSFRAGFEGSRWSDARLVVRHVASPGRTLLETPPGRAFVAGARGRERVRGSHGSFSLSDATLLRCGDQTVESVAQARGALEIAGSLACPDAPARFRVRLEALDDAQLRLEVRLDDPRLDRTRLVLASDPGERFFGFGEQFGAFDLKGRLVPILVSEQGIGRGRQPLTWLADLVAGAGGAWHSSYAPVPHLLTTRLRSLALENTEYSAFDLRDPERAEIEVFAPSLRARVFHGTTPLELVEAYTRHAGRMRALPDWALRGVIVGIQGGSQRVRAALQQLRAQQTPLGALWIQDWVGRRDTSFGQQLWWNWEVDRTLYPDWEELVDVLSEQDVRLLLYVNPFLVDPAGKPGLRRNLFAEARDRGYLVRRPDGEPAAVPITDFSAALVDLTNPEARAWLAGVMRDEMLARGASGWMADFGEALPWDAVLASGEPAASAHNRWPVEWARLNREVIEAAGRGSDALFFTRAGFTRSPAFSTLFWEGDQLVSWDAHDGIKSAVVGLLSGGLSGFALNHSDIGGYTTIDRPLVRVRRSRELLWRWTELGAFQVVFRNHEGSLPRANHQWNDDIETLRHFTRFAKVWAAWGFYREELVREAARTGAPVVRHPFLHHPAEPATWELAHEEFLVGSELLVAPVLDPGRDEVTVWFPPGRWVHVWSARAHGRDGAATRETVAAPLGSPAVFHRKGSAVGERFRENLRRSGALIPGAGGAPRISVESPETG
jgi:alpha-glucosidase